MESLLLELNLKCISICVITSDGYELKLYKVTTLNPVFTGNSKAILVMHGFLQDSDSFLCGGSTSLVYELVHSGYDVYLGNNRGNKYSSSDCDCKYIKDPELYWDYSMDELIMHDIPAIINHIYSLVGDPIVVIGFSQGSTQVFGALSMDKELDITGKVELFIALAPAISIPKMQHSTSLLTQFVYQVGIKKWPIVFFNWLLGTHSIFSFTPYCQENFHIALFVVLVRIIMYVAFGWTCSAISFKKQCQYFRYAYSPGSVKNAFHWYQMSEMGCLCKFNYYYSENACNKCYDLTAINRDSCPIALISGDRDTVIITDSLTRLLPNANIVLDHHFPEYEHLDLIWADDVHRTVNPLVFSLIRDHARNAIK